MSQRFRIIRTARLRAGGGDRIATTIAVPPGYETYCREFLGLDPVEYLVAPQVDAQGLLLADACRTDGATFGGLVELIRHEELTVLHPHMGHGGVWNLARVLQWASGRALPVIAPPPELTRWVNRKPEFLEAMGTLLGPEAVLPLSVVRDEGGLIAAVRERIEHPGLVVVKRPDSAGGLGNVLFESEPLRSLSVDGLRSRLMELIAPLRWDGHGPLLVEAWRDDVLASPSSQLWIPPLGQGDPILEGVFQQIVKPPAGTFVGSHTADLPSECVEAIGRDSVVVGLFLQHVGYMGRCSFDLVLTGDSFEGARHRFVECNGAGGGRRAR